MNGTKLVWSIVLGGAMAVAGCEKEEETTPSGQPAPVPQASEQAADDMKASADKAAEETKDTVGAAADAAQKKVDTAADAVKKDADAAAEAVAADPKTAEYAKQIEQVTTYIKEKKWDLAETTLKTLEANKAKLPAAMQGQVANLRTMLDTAKKSMATTAPSAK